MRGQELSTLVVIRHYPRVGVSSEGIAAPQSCHSQEHHPPIHTMLLHIGEVPSKAHNAMSTHYIPPAYKAPATGFLYIPTFLWGAYFLSNAFHLNDS